MAKKEVLTNFIPISRKLFEHRFWCEGRVYSKFEAWIDLLQFARFEDEKRDFGSKVITIKRGQCLASIRFLSNRWEWSRTKVETFLKLLEDDKMIVKSQQKDIGQTVITICNYEEYNRLKSESKPPKEPPQSHPSASAVTNYNKDNKDNKDNIITPHNPPTGDDDEGEKNWKDDFNIYLSLATKGYNEVISNTEFIKDRQRYHPELDILLSLEKAFKDYWSTEIAWMKRKKAKTKGFNWLSTYINALTNAQNKVYKRKGSYSEQKEIKGTGYKHPTASYNSKNIENDNRW